MNEDDLTQEDIDAYNQRRKKEYDDYNNPKDPNTVEETLKKRSEATEKEDTDPTTDKLESRGYKGNRKSIRQRQQEIRQRALADRDLEGNTVTRGPGQVFTGGKDTVEVPDRDLRTGEIIPNETEQDQFGNPVSGFQGSLGGSIAFEVGANTLLDIFSPFLPLQSGGSYVINLISQIIRDPSKIGSLNQLEAGAAATSSLIPGANQYAAFLKGIKPATRGTQVVRQLGRGIVDANINVAGERIGSGQELTGEDIAFATGIGGSLGVFLPRIAEEIGKDPTDFSKIFGNIRKRLDGGPELAAVDGFPVGQATPEFEPTTVFAMGRKPKPKPSPGQKNIFTEARENPSLGQSDEAINEQYQALYKKYDDRTIGDTIDENLTNKQKREKYSRKLQSTDLDLIIQEEALKGNTIPPEKAQEYVDLVNETRLGKKDRNNPSGRLRRNQKGYIGTMVYLNEVSLGINPNNLGNTADVIKHISKEMGTDPIGLKRIIEGQGGEISFQTEGMKTPKKIRSLKELVEAYYLRLSRYKDIPAFEKGHVFAANNIIEDRDINSLTDFKNNLEPEISRSIREQLDDEAIEELIKAKGTLKGDDFYRSVVEGNRKRQNKQDPDKILADLLGTQYGLRESFLTFINPERSLSNIIPVESKAAFAELYRKELLAEIKGIKADLKNSGQSSIGPATIDQLKLDVARSVAKGMKNNKILEQIILMDDMISKRGMTTQGQAKPLPDNPINTESDGTIKGDTPD